MDVLLSATIGMDIDTNNNIPRIAVALRKENSEEEDNSKVGIFSIFLIKRLPANPFYTIESWEA